MSEVYYRGTKFTILQSRDFLGSLSDLVAVHHKNSNADLAKGDRLLKVLGDCGKLRSPDQFRQETPGFWAIKAGKIRFYGWYEPNSIFVLSHTIFKSAQKLAQADIDRMNQNRNGFHSEKSGVKK